MGHANFMKFKYSASLNIYILSPVVNDEKSLFLLDILLSIRTQKNRKNFA